MILGKVFNVASNFVPGLGAAKTAMDVVGGLGGGGGGGGSNDLATRLRDWKNIQRNDADMDAMYQGTEESLIKNSNKASQLRDLIHNTEVQIETDTHEQGQQMKTLKTGFFFQKKVSQDVLNDAKKKYEDSVRAG